MKCGAPMQNAIPITTNGVKSKPELEFQYVGRTFSETGSSNNSAVDWDISSEFGVQIDFDIAERMESLKPKPKVESMATILKIDMTS